MGDRDQLLSDLRDYLRSLWKKTKQTDEDLSGLIQKIDNKKITVYDYTFFLPSGHLARVGAINNKNNDSVIVFTFGDLDNQTVFAQTLRTHLDQPYENPQYENPQYEEPKRKSILGRMTQMFSFGPKSKGGKNKRKTNKLKSRKSRKSRRRR
jgi:hypothetical protein